MGSSLNAKGVWCFGGEVLFECDEARLARGSVVNVQRRGCLGRGRGSS